jgi:hypothetical protein
MRSAKATRDAYVEKHNRRKVPFSVTAPQRMQWRLKMMKILTNLPRVGVKRRLFCINAFANERESGTVQDRREGHSTNEIMWLY